MSSFGEMLHQNFAQSKRHSLAGGKQADNLDFAMNFNISIGVSKPHNPRLHDESPVLTTYLQNSESCVDQRVMDQISSHQRMLSPREIHMPQIKLTQPADQTMNESENLRIGGSAFKLTPKISNEGYLIENSMRWKGESTHSVGPVIIFPNEPTNDASMSHEDRIKPCGELIFSSTGQVSRHKFNEFDLEKAITTNKQKPSSSLAPLKEKKRPMKKAIKVDKHYQSIQLGKAKLDFNLADATPANMTRKPFHQIRQSFLPLTQKKKQTHDNSDLPMVSPMMKNPQQREFRLKQVPRQSVSPIIVGMLSPEETDPNTVGLPSFSGQNNGMTQEDKNRILLSQYTKPTLKQKEKKLTISTIQPSMRRSSMHSTDHGLENVGDATLPTREAFLSIEDPDEYKDLTRVQNLPQHAFHIVNLKNNHPHHRSNQYQTIYKSEVDDGLKAQQSLQALKAEETTLAVALEKESPRSILINKYDNQGFFKTGAGFKGKNHRQQELRLKPTVIGQLAPLQANGKAGDSGKKMSSTVYGALNTRQASALSIIDYSSVRQTNYTKFGKTKGSFYTNSINGLQKQKRSESEQPSSASNRKKQQKSINITLHSPRALNAKPAATSFQSIPGLKVNKLSPVNQNVQTTISGGLLTQSNFNPNQTLTQEDQKKLNSLLMKAGAEDFFLKMQKGSLPKVKVVKEHNSDRGTPSKEKRSKGSQANIPDEEKPSTPESNLFQSFPLAPLTRIESAVQSSHERQASNRSVDSDRSMAIVGTTPAVATRSSSHPMSVKQSTTSMSKQLELPKTRAKQETKNDRKKLVLPVAKQLHISGSQERPSADLPLQFGAVRMPRRRPKKSVWWKKRSPRRDRSMSYKPVKSVLFPLKWDNESPKRSPRFEDTAQLPTLAEESNVPPSSSAPRSWSQQVNLKVPGVKTMDATSPSLSQVRKSISPTIPRAPENYYENNPSPLKQLDADKGKTMLESPPILMLKPQASLQNKKFGEADPTQQLPPPPPRTQELTERKFNVKIFKAKNNQTNLILLNQVDEEGSAEAFDLQLNQSEYLSSINKSNHPGFPSEKTHSKMQLGSPFPMGESKPPLKASHIRGLSTKSYDRIGIASNESKGMIKGPSFQSKTRELCGDTTIAPIDDHNSPPVIGRGNLQSFDKSDLELRTMQNSSAANTKLLPSQSSKSLYDCFNFKNAERKRRKKARAAQQEQKPQLQSKNTRASSIKILPKDENSHNSMDTFNTQESRKQLLTSPKLHEYQSPSSNSQKEAALKKSAIAPSTGFTLPLEAIVNDYDPYATNLNYVHPELQVHTSDRLMVISKGTSK